MAVSNRKRNPLLARLARQNIIDSVTRIITREGVQGMTMDKVAVEAGVAKGTLYRYFPTKGSLLRATVESCLAPLSEELIRILERSASPELRLSETTLYHLRFFDRHRDFFRVLLYDRNLARTKADRYKSSRYRTMVEKTAAVIDEGVRAGVFRPLDPLKVAAVFFEANVAMIGQRLISDNPEPVEEDAGILNAILLHGLETVRQTAGKTIRGE